MQATSALDAESESLVREGLDELMREKTVIVVAHRLRTVQKADILCVLEDGKIIETGTHKELLRHGGRYTSLVRHQIIDFTAELLEQQGASRP